MDGEVVIGITADSSDFDKKIYKLEKELKKREINVEVKAKDVESAKQQIKSLQHELDGVDKELDSISEDAQRLAQLEAKIGERGSMTTQLNQKEQAEYGILSMSGVAEKESELLAKREAINSKISESNAKLATQNQKLQEANELVAETKVKIDSLNQEQISQGINNIKNSMEGVVKKAARWGLAVFGIRSIYLGIRQAVGQLLETDENLKYQIDYMKWSIGQAIKPIVEWLVNAVHQLLVWIGAIIKILFGINIFANATAKNFQKANTNAKKLQKTLAGFDEMNILNEDGSTGVANSIGNALKGWDLAKEVDELSKKLKPFEDMIKGIAIVAGSIFGAKMIGGMISGIGRLIGSEGLAKLGSTLGKLGVIAGGIIITSIIAKKVWDEAGELKKQLDEIGRKGQEGQKKWIKNETDINKLIETGNVNRSAGNELLNKSGGIWNWLNGLGYANLENAKRTAENISLQIDKEKDLYKKKVETEGVTDETKELEKKIKDNIIQQVQYNSNLIQKLKENGYETKSIEDLNKGLIQNYRDMGGNVEEVKTELSNINKIKFDDKEIEVKVYASTTSFNEAMRRAVEYGKKLLGGLGFSAGGGGGGSYGGGGGGGTRAKGGIYYPSKLPKLAVGGIINNPGAGVPYNGATIGERGAEAVVPLTDSQQMALLGEAIGKYININATIPVYVGNRQIAREMQKINAENDFAYNR